MREKVPPRQWVFQNLFEFFEIFEAMGGFLAKSANCLSTLAYFRGKSANLGSKFCKSARDASHQSALFREIETYRLATGDHGFEDFL